MKTNGGLFMLIKHPEERFTLFQQLTTNIELKYEIWKYQV